MSRYPLHEKLQAIPDAERNILGSFLDWLLRESRYHVYEAGYKARLHGGPTAIIRIMGEYYDISPDGLAAEKDRMLAEIRVRNTLADIEKLGTDTT